MKGIVYEQILADKLREVYKNNPEWFQTVQGKRKLVRFLKKTFMEELVNASKNGNKLLIGNRISLLARFRNVNTTYTKGKKKVGTISIRTYQNAKKYIEKEL